MFARIATYRFTADPKELARKVEGGLLPIFMNQPGFRDYSLFADTKDVQQGQDDGQFTRCGSTARIQRDSVGRMRWLCSSTAPSTPMNAPSAVSTKRASITSTG